MSRKKNCLDKEGVWDQTKEICHFDQDGPDIIETGQTSGSTGQGNPGVAALISFIFPGGGSDIFWEPDTWVLGMVVNVPEWTYNNLWNRDYTPPVYLYLAGLRRIQFGTVEKYQNQVSDLGRWS